MVLTDTAKLWLGRAGALLSLAGIIFVVQRMASYASEIDAGAIGASGWLALLLLVLVYGVSNLLLAGAWWNLLHWLDVSVGWRWTLRTYATSQLAKYVPGNVMQFAGRQAMGVAAGIGNRPLLKSTLFELAMLCGVALFFAPLAAMGPPLALSELVAVPASISITALGLAIVARLGGRALLRVGLCQLGYLLAAGLVFAGCAVVAGVELSPQQLPAVVGAYVFAWLAGLVTPGAPAGLGVRDGLLLILLAPFGDPPVILLAVVLGRAATVTGDLGFFLAGNLVTRTGVGRTPVG